MHLRKPRIHFLARCVAETHMNMVSFLGLMGNEGCPLKYFWIAVIRAGDRQGEISLCRQSVPPTLDMLRRDLQIEFCLQYQLIRGWIEIKGPPSGEFVSAWISRWYRIYFLVLALFLEGWKNKTNPVEATDIVYSPLSFSKQRPSHRSTI